MPGRRLHRSGVKDFCQWLARLGKAKPLRRAAKTIQQGGADGRLHIHGAVIVLRPQFRHRRLHGSPGCRREGRRAPSAGVYGMDRIHQRALSGAGAAARCRFCRQQLDPAFLNGPADGGLRKRAPQCGHRRQAVHDIAHGAEARDENALHLWDLVQMLFSQKRAGGVLFGIADDHHLAAAFPHYVSLGNGFWRVIGALGVEVRA